MVLAASIEPKLQTSVEPISHSKKFLVLSQPLLNSRPSPKKRRMGNADENLLLGIRLRVEQPLFEQPVNQDFGAHFQAIIELTG